MGAIGRLRRHHGYGYHGQRGRVTRSLAGETAAWKQRAMTWRNVPPTILYTALAASALVLMAPGCEEIAAVDESRIPVDPGAGPSDAGDGGDSASDGEPAQDQLDGEPKAPDHGGEKG